MKHGASADGQSQQLAGSGSDAIPADVFRLVVHKTRMAMALADPTLPDCPLVFVNPAFCELTGYEPQEILGRNCRLLQGPDTDPEAVAQIRAAIAAREPVNVELYNYRRDGSGFWNALFISPVLDEQGRLTHLFASQFDVSSRKQAIRPQAQRVESMGALASGVAHEFNNLMTVVLGSIEGAGKLATEPVQKRQLERADWGAQRAGKLASELLSLAGRQARNEVVDLSRFLREFADTLAQLVPGGIRFDLDIPAGALPVRLDPEQLERVLLNLVRNAADAMPSGGRLAITACILAPSEAAAMLGGRRAIEILVVDTGVGMSPEIARRATELFFTTKPSNKGTGLGLFLALEFVDKSGGRLVIDSAVEGGTRIRLVFPQAG